MLPLDPVSFLVELGTAAAGAFLLGCVVGFFLLFTRKGSQ